MADNRMLLFARKPAPVQVTYLAYAGGTGVDAIDYRLTDRFLDPDPADDAFYLEKSIRLADSYWCYRPSQDAPAVGTLPLSERGHVTFASMNNFCKVSPDALALWAKILGRIEGSRLLMHAPQGRHREAVLQVFAGHGVSGDRIEFFSKLTVAEYFAKYSQADLALDPFPYAGGTTTCDALWMGVPVVTFAGRTAVGRGGVSILTSAGMPEWIATTPAEYLAIAVALASDAQRLSTIRSSLRERMMSSPLMDAAAFTQGIEHAYRTMWQRWCETPTQTPE